MDQNEYQYEPPKNSKCRLFSIADDHKEKLVKEVSEGVRPRNPKIKAPQGMRWSPIWGMSDEFSMRSKSQWLNRGKWDDISYNWRGRKPGYFKRSNVQIRKGELILRARSDKPLPSDNQYNSYSTAFVRTKNTTTYGYFEIMCRPMSSSISSVFWLQTNSRLDREVEGFRYSASVRRRPSRTIRFLKWKDIFSTDAISYEGRHKQQKRRPMMYDADFDLSQQNIIVGLNWQKDNIEWYLNGILMRRIKNDRFHKPQHLQLSTETMESLFGRPRRPRSKEYMKEFRVMYVRSWELKPAK